MKRFISVILLVLVCVLCVGAVSTSRLLFKTTGFSIQPLETEPLGRSYQAMSMFLPASGGFTPNVNVQVQCYTGTIEEFAAVSKEQFASVKFKLIKEEKQGKNSVIFEYSGEIQGSKHWYAKATATGKRVYLATATATEKQWPEVKAKMKECIDSLELAKSE